MANNTSFVFYKSFYDAMQFLDNDDKCEFMSLICDLAFNGVEADFTNINCSDLVKMLYTVSAEQIKASIKNRSNGAKGGTQKGENNKKSGVNTPLFTPLNTNVNVKENDKVKENDNVNKDITSFSNIKKSLLDYCSIYSLTLDEKAANKITSIVSKLENPQGAIKERLEYVFNKYPEESDDAKKALFYKSFSWDISQPETKTKKKIKSIDYSLAPKRCECGASVTPWGVPNSVKCTACAKTWELNNGLWLSTN